MSRLTAQHISVWAVTMLGAKVALYETEGAEAQVALDQLNDGA